MFPRMSLRCPSRPLIALGVLAVGGAGCSRSDEVDAKANVIGGEWIAPSDFSGLVAINKACSAARVGETRFLLAAHCLEQGGGFKDAFRTGSEVEIDFGATLGLPGATGARKALSAKAKVKTFFITRGTFENTMRLPTSRARHDVAVLEIADENSTRAALASVSILDVDTAPLRVGEKVFITGYGCEAAPSSHRGIRKAGQAYVSEIDESNVLLRFDATPEGRGIRSAGVCRGDSGGPLVKRMNNGKNVVVGVNSMSMVRGETGDRDQPLAKHSGYSIVARIDGGAGDAGATIGAWLAEALAGRAPAFDYWKSGAVGKYCIPAKGATVARADGGALASLAHQDVVGFFVTEENGEKVTVRVKGYLSSRNTDCRAAKSASCGASVTVSDRAPAVNGAVSGTNLRLGWSTSARLLGVVANGTHAKVESKRQDAWMEVSLFGTMDRKACQFTAEEPPRFED